MINILESRLLLWIGDFLSENSPIILSPVNCYSFLQSGVRLRSMNINPCIERHDRMKIPIQFPYPQKLTCLSGHVPSPYL